MKAFKVVIGLSGPIYQISAKDMADAFEKGTALSKKEVDRVKATTDVYRLTAIEELFTLTDC